MSKNANKKEDREFQYDLTKIQVDVEFLIALAIGVLAIAYGLLSYYKDNPLGTVLTDLVVIPFAVVCLILVYRFKERRFKDIKEKYIATQQQKTNRDSKMATQERGKDFLYGIFVALVGSLLVSCVVEYDNNVFGNGSRLAIGYWSFMFIVSSIAFFQFSKRILKGYSVQNSILKDFDWASIICVFLGIIGIVFAIAR